MKITLLRLRGTALFFAFLVLFQSCKTYYANSISLEKAVEDGKSASIIYSNDSANSLEFDKIVKIDTVYYGIKKYRGELVKMPIQLENTESIYKDMSVFKFILLVVLSGGIIWGIDRLGLGFLFSEDE
ncbi:hypothetical protein [Confluentibacter flavum]|nr:hypothetical protein [Confluentibacter flavum]